MGRWHIPLGFSAPTCLNGAQMKHKVLILDMHRVGGEVMCIRNLI